MVLVFAHTWGVPAGHADISNVYIKADKDKYLQIFLHIPQRMVLTYTVLLKLGVTSKVKGLCD